MLRLLTQGIRATQAGTALLVGTVAGLERHEQRALESFLRHPTPENANTMATWASVEHEGVEELFQSLPDTVAWKDGGKWQVVIPDLS